MVENEEATAMNITYETIFELLRREKNRDELQKLSDTFYSDIVVYLNEKDRAMESSGDDKTRTQVTNTRRMIRELFERREKKIIILALNKARTPQSIIDKNIMLETENVFFDELVEQFCKHRNEVLEKILKKNISFRPAPKEAPSEPKEEEQEETREPAEDKPEPSQTKTIKFLSSVPKFVGKELEEYGPYNPDDTAVIPSDIADILINKGRAEQITE